MSILAVINKPLRKIADVVGDVATWNPTRAPSDQTFRYIDLSSVNQETKVIERATVVRCGDAPSRARQLVRTGDVLVSTVRPNLNGVAIVPQFLEGATASTGFCVLRPRTDRVDGNYLFHWVRSRAFVAEMVRLATGASYPAVNDRIVLESRIPLPPLAEQRRIAEVLDRAEALRAKRRDAVARTDELKQALFSDLFGEPAVSTKRWPMTTVGQLLDSASYGTSEKAGAKGEYPVLRMNNITRTGDLDLDDVKYMDLRPDLRDRYLVRPGDVLFNRTNSADLVGKTAIVRSAAQMAYAGYLIRLRVNAENDGEYLAAFLNTPYAKRTLRGICKSIIGMANINASEVQAMRIPLPPLSLQREFARRVRAAETLKAVLRTSLAQLDALFASLQHRAFAGEL